MIQAFESDTINKAPIDEHIQSTLIFIQSHESTLHNLKNITRITESFQDNVSSPAIKFCFDSVERVLPQDLALTDNEIIRKSITVLVFLCDEISQLKEIAETRFYRSLLMFGNNPPDPPVIEQRLIKHGQEEAAFFDQPGMKEKMMGRVLPFLQELSNFIDRCYSVCLNLVQQVASLMNPNELLYRNIFEHTHLLVVTEALGDLLTVLISLDAIVKHNHLLTTAWNAYKAMISIARSDETAFNTNAADIAQFERLLVSINQSIMMGEIYKGCIEQNFETAFEDDDAAASGVAGDGSIKINVRYNSNYMAGELLVTMKTMLETALGTLGTNSETNERMAIVGVLGIYGLYRQLLPPNQYPDLKLHASMWGVQNRLPVVVLCDVIMWPVGEFLISNAYLDVKRPDPPSADACRRLFIQQFDQSLGMKTLSYTHPPSLPPSNTPPPPPPYLFISFIYGDDGPTLQVYGVLH